MDSEIISVKISRSVKDTANNDNHALDNHKRREIHSRKKINDGKLEEVLEFMRKSLMDGQMRMDCTGINDLQLYENYESSSPSRDVSIQSRTDWKKKLIIAAILFALLLVVILIALFQFRN
ncbi:uncharacterized protein LOC133844794 [Drosophila sulfurigaster albostrigata]|uniref:uncharacterized protein LOC133844794 n=1 Tax=Drosophila sulfurigaster albostrigata TaxID=89887 RepID=UPI002D21C32E|nr:uncharacterized protein LOC133844794 [Drosophila sulfurigaster albostrigata]